jgi:hypothetical protein
VLYSGVVTEGAKAQDRGSGGKSRRSATWLIWALYGLVTGLVIVRSGANLLSQGGSNNVFRLVGDALISVATPVVCAMVATLIVSRQPRNTIGWLLMVVVGAFVVGGPLESYVAHLAPSSPEPTVPLLLAVWFSNWGWLLLIFPLLYILLLFPNGRPPTGRWRWVGVAAIAWATLFVLIATLSQRLTTPDFALDNPIGVLGKDTVELLAGVWVAGLLALVVACAASLFIRYRRANDTERRQIKWLLYACAAFVVVYVGGFVSGVAGTNSPGGYVWGVFFGLSLVLLPAAIGIAILRYGLYEIDVVINRTLVYGALTATLVLVYFGGVAMIQATFRALSGQEHQPQIAVVISTLVIAALFNPLRRRIQGFIDRRFYRRKYDARKTLEAFSARLREETDLGALSEDLVEVVRETMQPSHVTLWLRPDTASKKGDTPS